MPDTISLKGGVAIVALITSKDVTMMDLPGPCLGLCVGVACFWLVLFLVGFFLPDLMLMLD